MRARSQRLKTDSAALFDDCLVASVCSTRATSILRSSISARSSATEVCSDPAELVAPGFFRRRRDVVGVHVRIVAFPLPVNRLPISQHTRHGRGVPAIQGLSGMANLDGRDQHGHDEMWFKLSMPFRRRRNVDAARDHDRHRSEGKRRPRGARAGDATVARARTGRAADRGRGRRHQPARRAAAPGLYPPPKGASDILGMEIAGRSSPSAATSPASSSAMPFARCRRRRLCRILRGACSDHPAGPARPRHGRGRGIAGGRVHRLAQCVRARRA